MFSWKNLKLSRLWCLNVKCLPAMGVFQIFFFFNAEIRQSADALSLRTKRLPHLFISGAPPHSVTTATVWRLRRVWCRAATPLSVTGTAKPTGSREEQMTGCERHHSVGRHARRWWEPLKGDQRPTAIAHSSFLPVFCRSFAQTRQKLPLLHFWEGHADDADDGFYTLNLSLCPPTDLFTNKVERPKVSVLNPCLQ